MTNEQQELIERVAKYVCEQNGVSPEAVYEFPSEEGVEYIPNWTRYVDDATAALDYIFTHLPVQEIANYTRIWKDIEVKQQDIEAKASEAPDKEPE